MTCRSRMLLAYFGETSSANCMKCDVCLQHTASSLRFGELSDVIERMEACIRDHGGIAVARLAFILGVDEDVAVAALQYLSDMERVQLVGSMVMPTGAAGA